MIAALREAGALAAVMLPVIAVSGMLTGQWLPRVRAVAGDPKTSCPEGCGKPVHPGPCNGGGQR